jgi:hypothetical protein
VLTKIWQQTKYNHFFGNFTKKKKGKVENGSKVNKPFEEEQSNLKSRVNIHKSPVHWKQGSI